MILYRILHIPSGKYIKYIPDGEIISYQSLLKANREIELFHERGFWEDPALPKTLPPVSTDEFLVLEMDLEAVSET